MADDNPAAAAAACSREWYNRSMLLYVFSVKKPSAIRQLQELTSEGHAEGVVDLSPGWSEAQPWVLNVNRRPAQSGRGSERVSSNVGISPGVGLLRSS